MRTMGFLKNVWRRKFVGFGKFELVEPGEVSPERFIPDHINKPCYYYTGEASKSPNTPEIKSPEQIDAMIESCRLASSILKKVEGFIKVGITTDNIDEFVHNECVKSNAYPSPLNYLEFPKSVCTSVNNVICHGIPDNRPLADGDIINVDVTVFYNSFHGDCSKTFLVGNVDEQGKELCALTLECLLKGISICGPNVPFQYIGYVIEEHASKYGYSVIPSFLGHGIGEYFHGPPDIYHTRNCYPGVMLPGMTFTIEPVLSSGGTMADLLEDGWTVVTSDNARSAQDEHTILVTDDGCKILT